MIRMTPHKGIGGKAEKKQRENFHERVNQQRMKE